VGFATSVNWPGDVGAAGNEGVANQVRQIPGAIGYVEVAYAKQNNMPWALLRNRAGRDLGPTLESTSAAADVPDLPDSMEVLLTDSANPEAYPIAGFTWLLMYENHAGASKAEALARLAWWMVHEGQQFAPALDYAPLKGATVLKAENLVRRIKAGATPVLP
jgi:phosphate transport system substrate-binding protein